MRPNNTGTIYYEKDRKKYRTRFYTPLGKPIDKRFNTKKEAEAWLLLQAASVQQGDFVEPSTQTVGGWVLEYLQTYSRPVIRQSTFAIYIETAKKLEPLAGIPVQKLTAPIVQKFLNDYEGSQNIKLKIYQLLNQSLDKAFKLGMVNKNIMQLVERPKYTHQEIQTFTQEEINILLDTVSKSKYYQKYYPFFLLAVSSGARLSELMGLKITSVFPDHIRIENNLQRISPSKRKDSAPKTAAGIRDIYLPSPVIAELHKAYGYAGRALGGYVFHTASGGYLVTQNMEKVWKKVLAEAGLPPRHFHALRHTHATELLAKGIPIIEVSKRLGHSKVSHTLDLYGHAIPGYGSKIADIVAEMLKATAN